MRRRKMVLKRRIRMVIAAFILILIGILVIPISHFKVAASEKNMRVRLSTRRMLFSMAIHYGGWQTAIWGRILRIIRTISMM